MHKNLCGLVKGQEPTPQDPKQLVDWLKWEDKSKSIIGLSLSNSQLHLLNLEKSSAQIWEKLSQIFGEKAVNANSPWNYTYSNLICMRGYHFLHRNDLKSLIRQLGETGMKIEDGVIRI